MTVTRYDPLPITEIEIDVAKKAGKEIGFNFMECPEQGLLVTEIVCNSLCNKYQQNVVLCCTNLAN